MLATVALAAVGAWGILQELRRRAAPPPPPEGLAVQAETYALLVGCGEYPYLRRPGQEEDYERNVRLRAPPNDVALLAGALERYLGVPRANIDVLTGWPEEPERRPTAANLLASLDRLARRVRPGAHVVFHFSGHGSQQADEDGDEPDGCDEVLLAADVGTADPRTGASLGLVRDDELALRLRALRAAGATVWALLDCCHSGTAARGPSRASGLDPAEAAELRTRGLDPRRLGLSAPSPRGGRGARREAIFDELGPLEGLATFAAAHDDEEAVELTLPRGRFAPDRVPHGLLTFAVVNALRRHLGQLTLAELGDLVLEEYRRIPWREATPLVTGDRTLRAGTGRREGGTVLVFRRTEGGLAVDAGALRGMTPGSVVEIFRPGRLGLPDAALARAVVDRVEPTRSWVVGVAGGGSLEGVPDGAPALLVSLAPGGEPLALALLEADGSAADAGDAALARLLPDPARRERLLIRAPWEADCWLRPLEGPGAGRGPWLLVPTGLDSDLEPLETEADGVAERLERLRRARALRRAAASGPLAGVPEGVRVEVQVHAEGQAPRPWSPGLSLAPGEQIDVRLQNATGEDVDVALQGLSWEQEHVPLVQRHTLARDDRASRSLLPAEVLLALNDDGAGRESLLLVVAVRPRDGVALSLAPLSPKPGARASPPAAGAGAGAAPPDDALAYLGAREPGARGGGPPVHLGLMEISWCTSWGRLGLPPGVEACLTAIAAPADLGPAPAAEPDEPRLWRVPWTLAGVLPGRPPRGADPGQAAVLVLKARRPAPQEPVLGLFLDADGDAGLEEGLDAAALSALAQRQREGSLPVELALLIDAEGCWAAYPRSVGDTRLGHVRVASPHAAHRAGERHDLGPGGWTCRATAGPWLSTRLVPTPAGHARARLFAALTELRRPAPESPAGK